MGVVRFPIECPGCNDKILLRVAVGLDERQPFFYVCPTCRAATRGALLWDGGIGTSLELTDGRILDQEQEDMTAVHINPDLPAVSDTKSMAEPEGSATIYFSCLIGPEALGNFFDRSRQFRELVRRDWLGFERLTTYYLNRDWKHFDPAIAKYLPDESPSPSTTLYREDRFHRLLEIFLAPIWTFDANKPYVQMKKEFNGIWNPAIAHAKAVSDFAKAEVTTDFFEAIQRDLFAQIGRFVHLIGGLLPGVLCDLIPESKQPEVARLRLFRDDYEQLRDLYVQAFESCHKVLRWVVGVAICSRVGTPDGFSKVPKNIPVKHRTPQSLDKFSELQSAEKRKWLALMPTWDASWDRVLDRQLRNDFGHASVRHDLPTGRLIPHKGDSMAYTEFVQRAHRILQPLLACTNVMKILRIAANVAE